MKTLGVLIAMLAIIVFSPADSEAQTPGIIYKCQNPSGTEFYIARSHGNLCQAFLRFKSGQWYRSHHTVWVYSGGAYQETSRDCDILTGSDVRVHMASPAARVKARRARRHGLDIQLHWGRSQGDRRSVQIGLQGNGREKGPIKLKCHQFQPVAYDPRESPTLTFND